MRALQRLVLTGKLRMHESLSLSTAIANSAIHRDANGNPGLDKAKSRGRIDMLSAAVIAAGLAEPMMDRKPRRRSVLHGKRRVSSRKHPGSRFHAASSTGGNGQLATAQNVSRPRILGGVTSCGRAGRLEVGPRRPPCTVNPNQDPYAVEGLQALCAAGRADATHSRPAPRIPARPFLAAKRGESLWRKSLPLDAKRQTLRYWPAPYTKTGI